MKRERAQTRSTGRRGVDTSLSPWVRVLAIAIPPGDTLGVTPGAERRVLSFEHASRGDLGGACGWRRPGFRLEGGRDNGGVKVARGGEFYPFWSVRDNFLHFFNHFSRLHGMNNIRLLSYSTELIYFIYTYQVYTYIYVDYSMYIPRGTG